MILPDKEIIYLGRSGYIQPFNKMHVNPASLDLTLGKQWRDMRHPTDIIESPELHLFSIFSEFGPKYVMAHTEEWLKMPDNLAGIVKSKTTPVRSGLSHPIAEWVDPGFEGQLTVMLWSLSDIVLTPGDRICQLVYEKLMYSANESYQTTGHYQGQKGPTLPWTVEGYMEKSES